MLQPLNQSIFLEGQRAPAANATPVMQFEEDPTVIPDPIHPAQALDMGINWGAIGETAFNEAGKVTQELLQYMVAKADTDIKGYMRSADKEINDLYGEEEAKGFPNQGGTEPDPMYARIREIQDQAKQKVADRLGAPNLFDKDFSTDGWGSHWFGVIQDAQHGMDSLSATAEKIQHDSFTSGVKQRTHAAKLQAYRDYGAPIESADLEDAYSTFRFPDGRVVNIHSLPEDLPEGDKEIVRNHFARAMVPTNGIGPVNKLGVDRVKLLVTDDVNHLPENEFIVASKILGFMSPEQIAGMDLNQEDALRLSGIGLLSDHLSPADTREFVRRSPESAFSVAYSLNPDTKSGSEEQKKRARLITEAFNKGVMEHWGTVADINAITTFTHTANVSEQIPTTKAAQETAARVAAQERLDRIPGTYALDEKRPLIFPWNEDKPIASTNYVEIPSASGITIQAHTSTPISEDTITNSPYMVAARSNVLHMLMANPNLDIETTVKEYLAKTANAATVYRTDDGDFEYVAFVPNISTNTKTQLDLHNKNRPYRKKTALSVHFSSSLAEPLDTSITASTLVKTDQRLSRALHLSRTAVPMGQLQRIVAEIRSNERSSLGARYVEGASEAQLMQYSLASCDEVLTRMNGGVLPTTPEDIQDAFTKALKTIPTADHWDIHISPTRGYLGVSFVQIPMVDTETGARTDLLKDTAIVPDSVLFNQMLTVRSDDGSSHIYRIEHVLDSKKNINTSAESKSMERWLAALATTSGATFPDTHKRALPSANPLGEIDLQKHMRANFPVSSSAEELEFLSATYPHLERIGLKADGTPIMVTSQTALTEILQHPGASAGVVLMLQETLKLNEAEARSMWEVLQTMNYGTDFQPPQTLSYVMYFKHKDTPLINVYADLLGMVRSYVDPPREEIDYAALNRELQAPSFSANTNVNLFPEQYTTPQFAPVLPPPEDPYWLKTKAQKKAESVRLEEERRKSLEGSKKPADGESGTKPPKTTIRFYNREEEKRRIERLHDAGPLPTILRPSAEIAMFAANLRPEDFPKDRWDALEFGEKYDILISRGETKETILAKLAEIHTSDLRGTTPERKAENQRLLDAIEFDMKRNPDRSRNILPEFEAYVRPEGIPEEAWNELTFEEKLSVLEFQGETHESILRLMEFVRNNPTAYKKPRRKPMRVLEDSLDALEITPEMLKIFSNEQRKFSGNAPQELAPFLWPPTFIQTPDTSGAMIAPSGSQPAEAVAPPAVAPPQTQDPFPFKPFPVTPYTPNPLPEGDGKFEFEPFPSANRPLTVDRWKHTELLLLGVKDSLKKKFSKEIEFLGKLTGPKTSPGAMGDVKRVYPDIEDSTSKISRKAYPVRATADGGFTTIILKPFQETKDGPFILIPITVDGNLLPMAQAVQHYQKTKQHFGIYSTEEKAHAAGIAIQTEDAKVIRTEEKAFMSFLSHAEGMRTAAYKDVVGKWTIGIGTTTYPDGRTVKPGDVITKEEAVQYARSYLYHHVLPRMAKIPTWDILNINQKAAIVSFAYNLGPGFYNAPNRESITRALSSPANLKDVPKALKLYNKGTIEGVLQIIPGLVNRRADEITMWNTPV